MTPRLLGTHEIRLRLGNVSRQRVHQIVNYRHFPRPIAHLALGNVWLADDVDGWIREHRPRNAPAPGSRQDASQPGH